jgi:hypothetical protein
MESCKELEIPHVVVELKPGHLGERAVEGVALGEKCGGETLDGRLLRPSSYYWGIQWPHATQSVQLQCAYSRPWVFLLEDGTRKCSRLTLAPRDAQSCITRSRVGDGVAGQRALGFLGFFAWSGCRIWGEGLGMADRVRTQMRFTLTSQG